MYYTHYRTHWMYYVYTLQHTLDVLYTLKHKLDVLYALQHTLDVLYIYYLHIHVTIVCCTVEGIQYTLYCMQCIQYVLRK